MRRELYMYTKYRTKKFLKTDSEPAAAELLLKEYYKGQSIGRQVFDRMAQYKNVITTDEDRLQYINDTAEEIILSSPLYRRNTQRGVSQKSLRFIKYSLTRKITEAFNSYLDAISKMYND